MKTLEQLIKESIAGNLKAQQELYTLFAAKLFGVSLKYSSSYEEAQDNFQESFIQIFNTLHQLKSPEAFEYWAKRITINQALGKYRKQQHLQVLNEYSDITDDEPDESELPDIEWEMLLKYIQELPERYRMVFNLYVLENYSHYEISKFLQISEGTSKSNLSRAKKILRDKIVATFNVTKFKI